MSQQAESFAELASELLAAGKDDDLVAQLADADLVEVWDDPEVVAAIAESYGRHAGTGRLLDVATLRQPDCALLLPVPGTELPAARHSGEALEVDGVVRGLGASKVACIVDHDVRLIPVEDLRVSPVAGFDPEAGLQRVTGRLPIGALVRLDLDPEVLVSRAARFLAHELLGTAQGALELALEHVRTRRQFGVAIGSFQAVRHRLAESHVQVIAAQELLAAIPPDAGVEVHLLVLKASAGAAAHTAVAAAQQVCGGMGFTEEFGLHRFVRRAYLLDSLLGGCEAAETLLGGLALDGQVLPDRTVVLW
jgi:hypothetical protein